jgi:hypothetical protein
MLGREAVMSIVMILRVPGDPDTFERYANDNPDLMLRILQAAKDGGLIHHQFAAGDGEIVVIDEWPDQGAFQKFFESQQDIPRLTQGLRRRAAPRARHRCRSTAS